MSNIFADATSNMFKDNAVYETLGPYKQHEGRRHVPVNQTNTFDFLKGGQGPEQYVGRPTEKATKYHNGFARRQHGDIVPEHTRLERENVMADRHFAREGAREQYLTQQGCRYGNVIQRMDGQQTLPHNRKHYGSEDLRAEVSQRRRRQEGGARFFTEDTTEHTQRRIARMENVTNRQQQRSSVLGVGRMDLESKGTWDNFSGTPTGLLQPLNTAERRERPYY